MNLHNSYAHELPELVTKVRPKALTGMQMPLFNSALASQLDLPQSWQQQSVLFNQLFDQNGRLATQAVAQKYGGHQFGQWNPDLGDGRGLLLAEVEDTQANHWDLHLKGAGQTPYSRFGDGRAVLRSTIREYLASEALYHLGIPSSRALCLIASNQPVQREKMETGAMLIRCCQSHIRFGHFEYFYHTGQLGLLDKLFDYSFKHHFADCLDTANPHLALLKKIVEATAELIAKWQAQAFNHGVMNSDNMSIHGIAFDFGPYAFLDDFDPKHICNHSDHTGRYAFDQQAGIALWNLNALAHAFTPYLQIEQIKSVLIQYEPSLHRHYTKLMHSKLGLADIGEKSQSIINRWTHMLSSQKRDYHIGFRLLCNAETNQTAVIDHFIDRDGAKKWFDDYFALRRQTSMSAKQSQAVMLNHNPKYILRNYLAQRAIQQAEQGDFSECKRLLSVLKKPFDDQPDNADYAKAPPEWGQHLEISCSS